ncbi:tail fiber assembly protein [Scandinavium goeteborgense]|uniref:tail fiber assembly protein n=1 Tax=Scandinavium goeteborgense TaxID=1851514 RepID=UPI001FEBA638|nr:tail fiber assembly protein [Scandinavium goeteborgense]
MTIYFSASAMGFFDDSLKADYKKSGSWPPDAAQITQVKYETLLNGQSNGNIITVNESGSPILTAPPPPTPEESIAQAETTKSSLMATASAAIAPLQDAVDLGIATDKEVEQLNAWKTYRVEVNRVDTSTAPDIEWPSTPSLII